MVILTALNVEYEAVHSKLLQPELHRHAAGTRFEIGAVAGGTCQLVLGLVGKGNHPAAVLAERAITEFAPVALVFVGVAGALWPGIDLGDVIVASHVYAYHGGTSEDDGLKARPRAWEIPHGADQIAKYLARTRAWTRYLAGSEHIPEVRFGPIAAGEVVQDSTISDHARWIREHYNDALAIEMEAAGVSQAAHLNGALSAVVVRGISDRADGTKATTDRARWQPRAAANAAAFAVALAEEIKADETASPSHPIKQSHRDGRSSMHNTNIARGNARVGFQAGQVFGGVSIGEAPSVPTDLVAELAALRDQVNHAHHGSSLDDSTHAAAEKELDVAARSLPADTPHRRGALLVALKRLRGLIADVPEIAAKVADLVTAVQGLS